MTPSACPSPAPTTCTTCSWCAARGATRCAPTSRSGGWPRGIHYPVPIHRTEAYAALGLGPGSLPVSEALAERILSLPLFPGMSAAELERVVEAVASFGGAGGGAAGGVRNVRGGRVGTRRSCNRTYSLILYEPRSYTTCARVAPRRAHRVGAVPRRARPRARRRADPGPRLVVAGVRRTCDVLVAGVLLLVLAPLLAVLALAIRLDSPGPAFFRQRRVGRGQQRVHALQVPHDGRRRRHCSAPRVRADADRRRSCLRARAPLQALGRRPRHPRRAPAARLESRRAAAALQRVARRDGARRAPARDPLRGRVLPRRVPRGASPSSPGSPACGR